MNVESLGTILGVWAHPDDETYLSAGLMAAAVQSGSRVACVTATRGEEGSLDPERWPPAEMGRVREAELERCLAILGVTEHTWLDYRDGTCSAVPSDEATARVESILEDVAPDTVLTFGPDGMTDHPDHKAVSAWATEAFRRASKPGAALFYATTTPEWAERFVPRLAPFNVFAPGTPPVTPVAELGINFEVPAHLMDVKLSAISEHTSQVEAMLAALGADWFRESGRGEYFRLAARTRE